MPFIHERVNAFPATCHTAGRCRRSNPASHDKATSDSSTHPHSADDLASAGDLAIHPDQASADDLEIRYNLASADDLEIRPHRAPRTNIARRVLPVARLKAPHSLAIPRDPTKRLSSTTRITGRREVTLF